MAEYKGAAKEGARAMALMKKREKMKADIEAAKNKISEVCFSLREFWFFVVNFAWIWSLRCTSALGFCFLQNHKIADISNKFSSHYDVVEQQLKSSTIGKLNSENIILPSRAGMVLKYSVRPILQWEVTRLNCRIPRHLFASHWIRIASIVIYLVLQSTPTHVLAGPGYSAIAPKVSIQYFEALEKTIFH